MDLKKRSISRDFSDSKNYFNLYDLIEDAMFEAQPDYFRQIIKKYWDKDQMLVDKLTIHSLGISQRLDLLLKETINISGIIDSYDENPILKIQLIGLAAKAKGYVKEARKINDYEDIISILYSGKEKVKGGNEKYIETEETLDRRLITREHGMDKVASCIAPVNWNLEKVADAFEKMEKSASKYRFYPLSEKFREVLQKYKVG